MTQRSGFSCGAFLLGALLLLSSPALASSPGLGPSTMPRPTTAAPAPTPAPTIPALPDSGAVGTSHQEYILGTGDRIKLTVFGEDDLSGEYDIGSTGKVALPLIGDVPAAGRPLGAFEEAVRNKLMQGYLRDPRVAAQVVNYRPFFILGEVAKPGSYPYVNGMTVVSAVALAGGYTYRANRRRITVTRAGDPQKQDVRVGEDVAIMPGDVIRVPERFF